MDPLTVIFRLGGTLVAAALVLIPAGVLGRAIWKRRAHRRNSNGRCAACGGALVASEERFYLTGFLTCEGCAATWRRRLTVALPAVATLAGVFAITSATALATSVLRGGPGLAWWLDGRFIPLLFPSVGLLGIGAWILVKSKRANRIAANRARVTLFSTAPAAMGSDWPTAQASVPIDIGQVNT